MTLGTLSLADINIGSDPLDNVTVVAGCYPADGSFTGPLPPGGVWCGGSAPAGMPVTASGSKSTIIAGVPDIAVYTLGGILLGFVFMGIKK